MSRFDVSRLLPNTLVAVLVMPGPHTSQVDGPCTRIGLFIGRCRGMAIVMLNRGQRQIRVRECWVMPDTEVARAKVEQWIAGQERDAANREQARGGSARSLRAEVERLTEERDRNAARAERYAKEAWQWHERKFAALHAWATKHDHKAVFDIMANGSTIDGPHLSYTEERVAIALAEVARLTAEVERLKWQPDSLRPLRDELARARRKFPNGARLVEALCEELGEAAREDTPGVAGNAEWLQVACVAMRLYDEGCRDAATSTLLPALRALEAPARRVLEGSGNA